MDLRVPANTTRYEARLSMLNQNLKRIFDLQAANLKVVVAPHFDASVSR